MAIYGIGVSALNAAQAGLATTSNNIANANTPGYSVEQIVQTQMLPQNTGSGFIGQGVSVSTVQRQFSQFLNGQVLSAQTQSSNLSTQLGLAQQVSNLLGDPNGGLTPNLQNFFTSVNAVANAPQSVPARQAMIGSAQTLVGNFQSLSQNLNQTRDSLNGQISNSVTSINSYATQIAALNTQIVQAQANNPNQPPNALLDQRDQLVNQLSQQISVSTIKQGDGSMNVYIGSGQSLVLGNKTMPLQTIASSTDPTALQVAYSNNGSAIPIQQSSLQGGNLGAYLSFRQTVLDPAINSLGLIAVGFANTFNQQQQQGTDLNGALGTSMFSTAAPQVTASSANVGNGTLTATINSVSALTGHDYSVRFDGTNYNVVDTTTNSLVQSIAATDPQLATGKVVPGTGITLQLTAGSVASATGDSFLVRPTVNGASGISLNITDPTKIAASSPVASNAPSANLGTGTIAPATVTGGLPLNANLLDNVTINFIDATHYTVTDNTTATSLAGSTVYNPTAGATISYNGWTTQISGTPSAGDKFTVTQNTNATADGSNMLQLAALQTANTLINGTTSYQGAYAQLIAQVGTQTSQLTVTSKAQTSMLSQATQAQQALSGVNLDEEAANLMRYQQAYQAAAKAMQIANTMFDTLLNLK